jgi:competence ComEA-like helix-hairpin-helix protein
MMLVAMAFAATAGVKASLMQAAAVSAQDEEKADKAGQAVTERVCAECHDLDMAIDMRRTPTDWNTVVITMATKGANATDDEFATIKKYLARHYGVVAVNSAAADEFTAVLGLTPKDAAAIVEYRNANGKFADAAALAKVPGIDHAKIEAQAEALRFH